MGDHHWIIEVNDRPDVWRWLAYKSGRGGLDVIAYRSKKEAASAMYAARQIYGHVRLTKFVPEGDELV
jgi:hypothetical protein